MNASIVTFLSKRISFGVFFTFSISLSISLTNCFLESGGFDEDFFIYGDDAELGLKLRFLGYKCMYVPHAVVYHHGSRGCGPYSLRKLYLIERNRIWVMLKFFPLSWILASPFHTTRRLLAARRAARNGGGIAGEFAHSYSGFAIGRTIFGAWLAAIISLPKTLIKRRRIMSGKKISTAEVKMLFRKFRPTLEAMSFGDPESTKHQK